MKGIRFIPEGTNINFIGVHLLAFAFSAVVLLASVGVMYTNGLAFGIDFTGGTSIEIKTPEMPDLSALRTTLNDLDLGGISIQEFGEPEDLMIRMPEQEETEADAAARAACLELNQSTPEKCPTKQKIALEKVQEALNASFEGEVDYRRTEFVGPQVGSELKMQGLWAVLFSIGGILAYIWFRFEWQFGAAAVIALVHDVVATLGLFALTGMEFNLSTVAAILTIAGYSINDTVVVFDRIRENLRKYKKKPLGELFNLSINEMLTRTIMTSFTTLIALIALYVFGGEVIRGFVDALIFGIVIGTYSSVFVASPVLLYMNIRRGAKNSSETKVAKA